MEAFPFGQRLVKSFTVCAAASLLLGLGGCKKPVASDESTEEAAPSANAPAATPSASQAVVAVTPAPKAAAPVPMATPEFAPPGVFYLIAAARVETSDGVTGLPPGTGVKLVRPGVYLTPAGEVTLNPSLLTNDMGVARRALSQEKAKQSTLEQQRLAAEAVAQKAAAAQAGSAQGPGNHSQPQGAPQLSALDQARRELSRQMEEVSTEIEQVGQQLGQYTAKYGSPDIAAKKSPQAFQLMQQLNSLQAERQNLQIKMSQIP